jgi:hypothetical protein
MYRDAKIALLLTKVRQNANPQETSLLLVDFNMAEDLDDKAGDKRGERTVSRVPIFIRKLPSLPFLPGNTCFHCSSC